MNQNIIGLVLKTGGYPEPVTVSGCHGNQAKFKISISKKFLKKFRHHQKTVYRQNLYTNSLVMGIFMRPTTISNYGNHLFLIEAQKGQFLISPPYRKQVITSPLAAINSFLIWPLIIIVPKFVILLFA